MSKSKSRVVIEHPQGTETYNWKKDREITVRTKNEEPDVTIGGGGGGDFGCSGCLGAIVGFIVFSTVALVLLLLAIKGCTYAVENYVIKKIDPNYVTSSEKAEKEEKEREKEAEKREARKPKNIKRKILSEFEKKLTLKGGYIFSAFDCCVLDNHIWVCGNLVFDKRGPKGKSQPAVAYSEDEGKSYRLISLIKEENHWSHYSEINFFDRNEGFLSTWKGIGGSILYKTVDGGKSWDIVLSTQNMGIGTYFVEKIKIINRQHIIGHHNLPGDIEALFKSYDGGESWIFVQNNEVVFAVPSV